MCYVLSRAKKWIAKRKQRNARVCPHCKTNNWEREIIYGREDVMTYKCLVCGLLCDWPSDSDFPIIWHS